ncbi:PilZ domain-containing protein [Massilia sp. W12]|uniref:PilZ domain-containing protein n=1 Tax=Massilia sp. W12 TaxID=3126507 RepID=UPI0030CD48DA
MIENRQTPRKVLRVKTNFAIDGAHPMVVRSMDVGANGMALSCPVQIPAGANCFVAFEMFFNGKTYAVSSRAKVMYCIYSSHDGFKVGLQFQNIDLQSSSAIARYMEA